MATPSTREGSATRACGLFGFACEVIAAMGRRTGVSRGDGPRLEDEPELLKPFLPLRPRLEPRHHPDDLRRRLPRRRRRIGVMPSAEYDGDSEIIVHEFDPWA